MCTVVLLSPFPVQILFAVFRCFFFIFLDFCKTLAFKTPWVWCWVWTCLELRAMQVCMCVRLYARVGVCVCARVCVCVCARTHVCTTLESEVTIWHRWSIFFEYMISKTVQHARRSSACWCRSVARGHLHVHAFSFRVQFFLGSLLVLRIHQWLWQDPMNIYGHVLLQFNTLPSCHERWSCIQFSNWLIPEVDRCFLLLAALPASANFFLPKGAWIAPFYFQGACWSAQAFLSLFQPTLNLNSSCLWSAVTTIRLHASCFIGEGQRIRNPLGLHTTIREVRWVWGPGSDRTPVSPVRTEPDGPQKRLGES